MNRRQLLQQSALLPLWLSTTSLTQESGRRAEIHAATVRALRGAWDEAVRSRRPLLLLVVPPHVTPENPGPVLRQPKDLQLRGLLWAQVVQVADDRLRAEMSLCVIACGTMAQAREALPEASGLRALRQDDPLAVLVEPDLSGARPIEVAIERIPHNGFEESRLHRDGEAPTPFERAATQRANRVARAISAAVLPAESTLARRAEAAGSVAQDLPPFDPGTTSGDDLAEWMEQAPAIVLAAATYRPDSEYLVATMAEAFGSRMLTTAPPGARWGRQNGCGTRVDGLRGPMYACGMGLVADLDRRFLYFYAGA